MINLKELEQEIDELLERQTSESLSEWLVNHRLKQNLWNFLGEGTYEAQPSIEEKWNIPTPNAITFVLDKSCLLDKYTSHQIITGSKEDSADEQNNYAIAA